MAFMFVTEQKKKEKRQTRVVLNLVRMGCEGIIVGWVDSTSIELNVRCHVVIGLGLWDIIN